MEAVLVEDGLLTGELYAAAKESAGQHPELKVISLPADRNLGKALNEGLRHCSYDLVARMDTDDIAKPNRFEKQLTIFLEHLEIDVVGAWIDEFEGEVSNVLSMRKVSEQHENILGFAKGRRPVSRPVVMFRKPIVLKARRYKHFPLFEDYYLWVRMLMNGARFYSIQESLFFFHFSPDMFRRRGGWRCTVTEVGLQTLFHKVDFIGFFSLLENVYIRLVIRLLPNGLRSSLYRRLIQG